MPEIVRRNTMDIPLRRGATSIIECRTGFCIFHHYDEQLGTTLKSNKPKRRGQQRRLVITTQAQKLYAPIPSWEIRILALRPGQHCDNLVTNLHLAIIPYDGGVVLTRERFKTTYEALSYCWGVPLFERLIEINKIMYPVTRSLESALRRLRLKDRTRYLWIDALCINQYDNLERSSQVQKMLTIYEHAQKVLVWLGEYRQHTRLVVRCLSDESGQDTTLARANVQNRGQDGLASIQNVKNRSCKRHFEHFITGVKDLLTRPWYGRLWVKQEVWKAREIVMVCGWAAIDWDTLVDLAQDLEKYLTGFNNPFAGLLREAQMERTCHRSLRADYQRKTAITGGPRTDLPNNDLALVLERTCGGGCSDLRDYVYAIIGMSNAAKDVRQTGLRSESSPQAEISMDYAKPVAQVYQDTMHYLIQRTGDLRVFVQLWGASRVSDSSSIYGGDVDGNPLPSWCPNWSKFWTFDRDAEIFVNGIMYTSGRCKRPITGTDTGSNILCLSGLRIAEVDEGKMTTATKNPNITLVMLPMKHQLPRRQMEGPTEHVVGYFDSNSTPENGDVVVLVNGSRVPIMLRPTNERESFKYVGLIIQSLSNERYAEYILYLRDVYLDDKDFENEDVGPLESFNVI